MNNVAMSLKKDDVERWLHAQLLPRLSDQDWVVFERDSILKIHDETLFGLYFERSAWTRALTATLFIRPLYWPCRDFAFPICRRTGAWLGGGDRWFGLEDEAEERAAARALADAINTRVAPLFAGLPDGRAILRYHTLHPRDPLLGWGGGFLGVPGSQFGVFGYIAAWSGARTQAALYLRAGRRAGEAEYMREHACQTLALLKAPDDLRVWLAGTAESVRRELELDRALPLRAAGRS